MALGGPDSHPDRRGCDGQSKVQLQPSDTWQAAVGLRCIQPGDKKGDIKLVEQRDAPTLQPIIQRIVTPGSTIRTDKWVTYNQLSSLRYIQLR